MQKNIMVVEPSTFYSGLEADLARKINDEFKVCEMDYVDAIACFEIGVYTDIIIIDDAWDQKGELLAEARRVNPDTKIMICSSSEKDITSLLDRFNISEEVVISKPFSFEEFEQALRKITKEEK